MDAEADISRKEQLQRNARACAELLRRLLRFHSEHAPLHMRKLSGPAAATPASVGARGAVAAIIGAVSAHHGIAVDDIVARGRAATIVEARQIAIYLARQLTTRSLAEIARCFGRRDHTTILHAVRKIERRRQRDRELMLVLDHLAAQIKSRKRRAA
jgi:chromosomal replication initiation ATPase DnaA